MEQNYDAGLQDIDKILQEREESALDAIRLMKEEINNGNTSCSVYYNLFINQKSLRDAEIKYKSLLDTYAQSTIKAGLEEISNNSASSSTYINMASVYDYLKDDEKALFYYSRAVELYPDDADAYLSRGLFYHERKKTKLANIDLNKAIELDPENKDFVELMLNSDKLLAESGRLLVGIKIFNIIFWGVVVYVAYSILSTVFPIVGEIFKTFNS